MADPRQPRSRHGHRPAGTAARLRRGLLGALTALGVVAAAAAPALAADQAPAGGGDAVAGHGGKGPVGWDVYRHPERFAELRSDSQTLQFSSFDRAGGNNDGFAGTFSCLRTTDEGCVIAERSGAGELASLWFTRDNGIMTGNGRIRIDLDGQRVLDASLQDVVDGKLGAPFVWPLVGNGDDTAGGSVIKVPMPFRNSMRVTVEHNPFFYHVTYRAFADAAGVSTFDPSDRAEDVVATLRGYGLRDPKPTRAGSTTRRSAVDTAPGATSRVATLNGPGQITALRLRLPQGQASPRIIDDGRAYRGAGSGSTFTVAVDPRNDGVRLINRFDPKIGNQRTEVLVDGQPAGEWTSGPATPNGRWVDQELVVPAELTAGKKQITVTNQFAGSVLDVNEFRYDVSSRVNGEWVRTDVLDLGPGHPGDEKSHDYAITGQSWQGFNTFRYPLDDEGVARLAESDAVLDGARLRITFDGQTTVDAPLGEFFGSGLGEYETRSLMYGMDTRPDGWYSAWWPMPFRSGATVEIVNRSGVPIRGATAEVTSVADPSVAPRLGPAGDLGYFHATARRAEVTPDRDHLFLDAQGQGVYYGATHTMRGLITSGNRRDYLEGDERVYVDGSASPSLYGTGTEDLYESGWYFRNGTTYTMPLAGNPSYETDGDGCQYDCTGAFRLFVSDAVSFESSLRFGVEHGPADNEPADYSSTAYWYGRDAYALRQTDSVEVTDAASRSAHGYRAVGETRTDLSSSFEGQYDRVPVDGQVTSATGRVTMRLRVDPDNTGVVLSRLSDQQAPYQAAEVAVNGRPVGVWQQPLGNDFSRWLQDSFALPAALTADRESVTVTLTPVDGAPAWSAARYSVASKVRGFTDHSAPGGVSGLSATGGETNAVRLRWQQPSDNVGVARYQVYASRSPSVPVTAATLVGETVVPGFVHSGLGLQETWYYRVRAVDGAGNIGPVSQPASAATGNTLVVEGESMLPAVDATAEVSAQGNCCGITWSGNAQLWFLARAAGATATVRFSVPATGSYDLSAVFTQARDYGIVALSLDGAALGEPFDGYHSPEVVITPPMALGSAQLTAGTHELTLTVTGKNPASSSYLVGLDLIRLVKTD